MMMKYVFLPFALLLACKTTPTSLVKHDAENPIGASNSAFWATQTDDEYINLSANANPYGEAFNAEKVLPETHPIRQRLQTWADRLDATLRDRYPGTLDHIPKPHVRVLNTNNINAY
ncbi:MAG: hypothetical protein EOP04_12435, partial [Proteobacteria bacterium]